jgi:hypothetical protein
VKLLAAQNLWLLRETPIAPEGAKAENPSKNRRGCSPMKTFAILFALLLAIGAAVTANIALFLGSTGDCLSVVIFVLFSVFLCLLSYHAYVSFSKAELRGLPVGWICALLVPGIAACCLVLSFTAAPIIWMTGYYDSAESVFNFSKKALGFSEPISISICFLNNSNRQVVGETVLKVYGSKSEEYASYLQRVSRPVRL